MRSSWQDNCKKKCRELRRNLCLAFIDLSKTFDTVNREMLFRVLQKFGCPENFTAVIRAFHDGMKASVVVEGEETSAFDVRLRAKQGCVLASVLLKIYLATTTVLFHERFPRRRAVRITYRLDRSIFNLGRLQARTKVSYDDVSELQYADDCVLITHSPEDLQESLDVIYSIYSDFDLGINTDKTEVMYQ